MKKTISILGSTGSIGLNTFKIINKRKNNFQINLLSANKNLKLISKQIKIYKPKLLIINDKRIFKKVAEKFKKSKTKILNSFEKIHNKKISHITVSAIPGIAGLKPTILMTKKSNKILIANKESIICGWNLIKRAAIKNKTKLIYSATSATLGNKGDDKNLSPYAFTKAKNLELLENLKKWFNFKFEIIYFYNVYGERQIEQGPMATVIGIFQYQYKKRLPLSIVRPGTQTRRFTHISDTVDICIKAWKINKSLHYSISHRQSYSIKHVAKMFGVKTRYLPPRPGERFASALTNLSYNNKVIKYYGKINLKDYITSFIKNEKKKL